MAKDREEMLALLDAIRARGGTKVELDPEGNLKSVEFTPGGPDLDPSPQEDEKPDAFELALRQVKHRSFDAGKIS